MSLIKLRIYMALVFFISIGVIEYKVLKDNKQTLAIHYTKQLKAFMHDMRYIAAWKIEEEQNVEAPLLKTIINNSKITHNYIKNMGILDNGLVTYATYKKMISMPPKKPLIGIEEFSPSSVFNDQYITIPLEYYLGDLKYHQSIFVEIDKNVLKEHFWATYIKPSIELILGIIAFLAVFLLIVNQLVVHPVLKLSEYLNKKDIPDKLPSFYLWEMEDLKQRFLNVINKMREEQQEKALASSVFENTQEAILIADDQKKIVSVNNSFVRIFGYARNELIGQYPNIIGSGKHNSNFFKDMDNEIETRGQWSGELINCSRSGTFIPVWVNISAIRDENNDIINYIAIYTDITQMEETKKRLEYISQHDNLTGLVNKKTFESIFEQILKKAMKNKHESAVLLIDIDNFQELNDTYGHNIGDKYLIEVSEKLQELGRNKIISRIGGDEFLIGLEKIDNIAEVLEKLYTLFREPIIVDKHEFYVKLSTGISVFPKDGESVSTLIKNADTAMYQAKEAGKHTYTFYQQSMTDILSYKIDMEKKIYRALQNKELTVYYQPQMSLLDKKIVGVEALVRWTHPLDGMIPPDQFIPIAEKSHLIHDVGLYVLDQACTEFSLLVKDGLLDGTLAVNISSRQLQLNDIKESLSKVLFKSKLDPTKLELEVTESLLMQNPENASLILNELRKMGITIAIDDFGTGYSSLSYLNTLPLDKLKIDKSFIDNIISDEGSRSICKAIIAMGNSMNIKTIAEGIETKEQMDLVGKLGCTEIQGYFFAKPMDIQELRKFIHEYTNHYNLDS